MGGLIGIFYYLIQLNPQSIFNVFSFLLFISIKLLPALIIASSLSTIPVGKLLASLQKLAIPNSILLTFTVALRFFLYYGWNQKLSMNMPKSEVFPICR